MNLKEPTSLPKDFSFGSHIADHMLEVHWNPTKGWSKPQICPVHSFSFSPFGKSLHFGLSSTDGFAVYKSAKGQALLLRPYYNYRRFISSSREVFFPKFEYVDYIRCLEKLIQANKTWIPEYPSGLFIKPLMFTEEESLIPSAAENIIMTIIAFPFKPIYGNGPIKLMLAFDEARCAYGGAAGNYLPANHAYGMKYLKRAISEGYDDVLYMDSEKNVTGTSTGNFFLSWMNDESRIELLTPSLRGSVLPGTIRDILTMLIGESKQYNFQTTSLTMNQLIQAGKEKRVTNLLTIGDRSICMWN